MNAYRELTSRRAFLKRAGVATATATISVWLAPVFAIAKPLLKCKPRPDLLDAESPKGLEVLQLTTKANVPWAHLYMEAQVFATDSKRFVLHRSATAHGGSKSDPKHQYYLCDIENNLALSPLT